MKKIPLLILLLTFVLTLTGCALSSSKIPGTSQSTETTSNQYSWEELLQKLHSGEVQTVAQSHDLTVVFYLKNGQEFSVKEPEIDDIFDEIKKCGDVCVNMELMTE